MDLLDKKIIYELSMNSRISLSKLAKKLKLKRNTLEYRLHKLIESNIIKNFFSLINSFNLGFTYYKYFLKVEHLPKNIIEQIFCLDEIVWVGKTDGYWDLAITLKTKDIFTLNKIISKIDSLVKIKEKSLNIIFKATQLNERWLITNSELKEFVNKYENKKLIDNVDKEILNILSINGRETTINIARKIGFTPEAISKRIKKLEKEEIIIGYGCRINYSKLDFDYAHILLTLKNSENKEYVSAYLKSFPKCITVLDLIGQYDLSVEFIAKNYKEISKIIDNIKNKFPDQIQDIRRLFIVKESNIKTF